MEKIFSKSKITREDTNKLKLIELDNSSNLMVYSSTRVGLQVHPLDYEFFIESKEKFKPYKYYKFILAKPIYIFSYYYLFYIRSVYSICR